MNHLMIYYKLNNKNEFRRKKYNINRTIRRSS